MGYKPREDTKAMLDRAYQLVKSVPYSVSARWVFYQLLQEGYFKKKDDYKTKCLPALSRARHAFYKSWRPDTLSDDTREAVFRGTGYKDSSEWLKAFSSNISISLNKWYTQDYYVELWFEARAMADQFRFYTENITLRAMAGQPSIPFKWEIAKHLERSSEKYGNPVVILYFGDLDDAGQTIADTVERDVRKWCSADFELIHCGLTLEQAQQWRVPENPEKPGQYQWEALSDQGAQAIIDEAVDKYVDPILFDEVQEQETELEFSVRRALRSLL